jgi:hypothetical protein
MSESVSHALLLELVAAGSIRSATAIADGDCWFLMVRYGWMGCISTRYLCF